MILRNRPPSASSGSAYASANNASNAQPHAPLPRPSSGMGPSTQSTLSNPTTNSGGSSPRGSGVAPSLAVAGPASIASPVPSGGDDPEPLPRVTTLSPVIRHKLPPAESYKDLLPSPRTGPDSHVVLQQELDILLRTYHQQKVRATEAVAPDVRETIANRRWVERTRNQEKMMARLNEREMRRQQQEAAETERKALLSLQELEALRNETQENEALRSKERELDERRRQLEQLSALHQPSAAWMSQGSATNTTTGTFNTSPSGEARKTGFLRSSFPLSGSPAPLAAHHINTLAEHMSGEDVSPSGLVAKSPSELLVEREALLSIRDELRQRLLTVETRLEHIDRQLSHTPTAAHPSPRRPTPTMSSPHFPASPTGLPELSPTAFLPSLSLAFRSALRVGPWTVQFPNLLLLQRAMQSFPSQ